MLAREVLAMVAALEGAKAYYMESVATTMASACVQTPACLTNPISPSGDEIVPIGTVNCGSIVVGDTTGNSAVNPGDCDTSPGTNGAWYKFEDSCFGSVASVTFSLCDSSFDTKILAWDASACDGDEPSCLGGNDDFCGLQSSVTVNSPNMPVYVLITGFNTGAGAYEMDVTCA